MTFTATSPARYEIGMDQDLSRSTPPIQFTPKILHSYPLLKDYLFGDKIDNHVREKVKEAGKHPDKNWMGRWKIIPLAISLVLQAFFSLFVSATSYLLLAASLSTSSYQLENQLRRWAYQLDILSDITLSTKGQSDGYFEFGDDFLAPSHNGYSLDAVDLYLHPPLLRAKIRDERVRNAVNPFHLDLGLDKNTGVCFGESRWFLRHYFKTKDLFENHRDHMQALGKQFSWGAPPQAALLQKIYPDEIGQELTGLFENLAFSRKIIKDDPSYAKKPKYEKIAEEFQNLQPGAYLIAVPQHSMAYVCVQPGEGYFFDPNVGTVAIHDQKGYDNLAKRVLCYHEEDKPKERRYHKEDKPKEKLCELTQVYPI